MLKVESHAFAGMQSDAAYSKQPSEYLIDAHNIRISARDSGKLLSITNEKGPEALVQQGDITGTILGYCTVNNHVVVFTHYTAETEDDVSDDFIYRIDINDREAVVYEMFRGNLNFDTSHPIEAIGFYDAENIQKIYWTDGKNQPRIINISLIDNESEDGTPIEGAPKYSWAGDFDFCPELALKETVTVVKRLNVTGSFAPGVIQYALTYYNKYRQETNIFYTSPLLYTSHNDRGGSPEDKVENAFEITVSNLDKHFEYIRIYSILRTSVDTTPLVKRVQDIKIEEGIDKISFIDTGTIGDDVDPTELLYKGGETVTAQTIEQKDNTLFLGNITLNRPPVVNIDKSLIRLNGEGQSRTFYPNLVSDSGYIYANQLTSYKDNSKTQSVPCGGFKSGDTYRCGVQFQYKTGKWSDPVFIDDIKVWNSFPNYKEKTNLVTVPIIKGIIPASVSVYLISKGYVKARAVVVFPDMQDRTILCQGVVCPTLYTENHRADKDLYAQSSWYFRPYIKDTNNLILNESVFTPCWSSSVAYTSRYISAGRDSDTSYSAYNPAKIRSVEIQGDYDNVNKFRTDTNFVTFHSPDIVFDDSFHSLEFTDVQWRPRGYSMFTNTLSDIDIQTESPTISSSAGGFCHKSFTSEGSYGINAGLFYEDCLVDDDDDKYRVYPDEKCPVKWMVYPWHRSGSLNNDASRPANSGTRSAVLKKKVISNLRFAKTIWGDYDITEDEEYKNFEASPRLFSSDQVSIIKAGDNIYKGNIDTLLMPDNLDGNYFAFGATPGAVYKTYTTPGLSMGGYKDKTETTSITKQVGWSQELTAYNITTPFNCTGWWKTYGAYDGNETTENYKNKPYFWNADSSIWSPVSTNVNTGNRNQGLVVSKEQVRMKYKSTDHLVCNSKSWGDDYKSEDANYSLPIIEIVRPNIANRFGGKSSDALKSNLWLPCGEAVMLSTSKDVDYYYEYGDTYYQRWDCLKTYPFTTEDINQIVEIGSFMLETRVNIDGRYDRNRGQLNNTNMSPTNFNLYNPIYSQKDNFFNYRILDEDYYRIDTFPNQITWTKEKSPAADVDDWTSVTLASTYNMDGSKGKINALKVWNDRIYCFQDNCISNILFNSRVQIPVSEGVPIEVGNSYKMDGKSIISDGLGSINKYSICSTPSALYFIDSVGKHLQAISGQGISDLSLQRNMVNWIKGLNNNLSTPVLYNTRLFYDKNNFDIYIMTGDKSLCYNEALSQFISFYDYNSLPVMFNITDSFYCINKGQIYKMFAGEFNNVFGEYKPFGFKFVSNGHNGQENLSTFDKIFSNLDYRADRWEDKVEGTLTNKSPFNVVQVENEYQDTGLKELTWNSIGTSILKRKFRIWRVTIPRDKTHKMDRIRSPWSRIYLGFDPSKEDAKNNPIEFHDISVQFYI